MKDSKLTYSTEGDVPDKRNELIGKHGGVRAIDTYMCAKLFLNK